MTSDIPATPTPEELKRLADQLDMVLPDSHMSTSHHDLERLRRASKTLRALAAARATDQQRIAELSRREQQAGEAGASVDLALAKAHTNASDFIVALDTKHRARIKTLERELREARELYEANHG